LLGADLGMAMTTQIMDAVKKGYETQGGGGLDVFAIAEREVEVRAFPEMIPNSTPP